MFGATLLFNWTRTVTIGIEPDAADVAGDPRFVRRLIAGMTLVVVLSAPTYVAVSFASHLLLKPARDSIVLSTLAVPLMSSSAVLLMIYGFWYALAAAFAHASIIGVLAYKGADSPWIAIGLGCAIGVVIPFAAAIVNTIAPYGSNMVSKLEAVRSWPDFALSGIVMGWLNWWIAIRPRRLSRIDQSRDIAVVPSSLRVFVGIVLTSLAAGPTFALMAFGGHIVGSTSVAGPLIIGVSAFFGILLSLPASVINATIVSALVRFGLDDVHPSIISGAIIGSTIPIIVSTHDDRAATASAAGPELAAFVTYAVTGALMSLLYWMIAVRPRRRQRLALEATAMREFANSVQEQARRAPRVPWDGRLPSD